MHASQSPRTLGSAGMRAERGGHVRVADEVLTRSICRSGGTKREREREEGEGEQRKVEREGRVSIKLLRRNRELSPSRDSRRA